MKENQHQPADAAGLRHRAEERLSEKRKSQSSEAGDPSTAEETARLVHELQVHQIELEMQNEELKTSQVEVEAGLALYSDLYDFAPTGYMTLDREGAIRQVNLTGARLLGVERSRLVNRRFGLFVAEGDRRAFSDFLEKVFASQAKECCEVTLPQEGSQPLVVRIEGTRSADGQECRAVVLDLTASWQAEKQTRAAQAEMQRLMVLSEQSRRTLLSVAEDEREAAEALRASEARYRTLAESAEDIIYVINREFRVEYVNEYGARQFGRSTREMVGRHLTELFPPETTEWQLADMAGVFRTGESLHRERQLPAGQRLLWLDTRLVPIKNATGEVESILGISRDITERKRTEEALQKSHEHYRRVIEDIFKFVPEALLVFTRNLDLFKENQAFEDLVRTYAPKLHYTEPELRGLLLQEIRAKVLSGDAGAIRIPPKNRDGQGTRGPDHSGEGVEPPAPPIPGFS